MKINKNKIFHFVLNENKINKEQEKKLILLYPKYIANKAVFLDSDLSIDEFYLIQDLDKIVNFINDLKSLNLKFLYKDLTLTFLKGETNDLDSEKLHKIMNLYYIK